MLDGPGRQNGNPGLEPTEVMDTRCAPSPHEDEWTDRRRIYSVLTPRETHAASLSKTLGAMIDPVKAPVGIGEAHNLRAEATSADRRGAVTSVVEGVGALASSGSLDFTALQPGVGNRVRRVDELKTQSQLELNRDPQFTSIRKSKNRK